MRVSDASKPAVVVCTGVSLYLSKKMPYLANLRQIATLAPGSILAMAFYLPIGIFLMRKISLWQLIAEQGARCRRHAFH